MVAAEKAAAEAVSALEAELANTKHTLSTETDRFNLHAEAAKNKFTELHHSFEAARSAETQAGAYTRPLSSSTRALSDSKYTLPPPSYLLSTP